jgi:hypothetical protein
MQNPEFRYLGYGQRVLNLRGTKWIVRRRFLGEGSLRGWAYEAIITALENGDFVRLKKCKECEKFFVAEDLRQKFCNPQCTRLHHDKEAADRVRRSRKRKKVREGRKRRETTRRNHVRCFGLFLKKAGGGVKQQTEVGPFFKKKVPGAWNTVTVWLRQQRDGTSPRDIWVRLSSQIRKILRELFQEMKL